MRPTLRQLQYLVALAEAGKFAEAARMVNVSQPSLSTQLADMEMELGTQLVERGRHGAILTPSGNEVVRKARDILSRVEALKTSADKFSKKGLSGRLRLGVIPSIGPYLLPRVTRRLHEMYPDFRISVLEEKAIELDGKLKDGRLDTIISVAEDHPNVESIRLLIEDLWICVAPDHELAGSEHPVTLADLKGHSLLSLGHGHNLNAAIRSVARLSGAYVNQEYEGTSLDAIRQMAAMGAGAAVLPSLYALVEARRDDALVVRQISHPMARREIALLWRDTSAIGEKMEDLAEVLKDAAEALVR